MTAFADVTQLIEALWAALHTQVGAWQLQKWGQARPARLVPWTRAQLAGRVAPLAAGAVSVIPEETHPVQEHTFPGSRSL